KIYHDKAAKPADASCFEPTQRILQIFETRFIARLCLHTAKLPTDHGQPELQPPFLRDAQAALQHHSRLVKIAAPAMNETKAVRGHRYGERLGQSFRKTQCCLRVDYCSFKRSLLGLRLREKAVGSNGRRQQVTILRRWRQSRRQFKDF